MSPGIIGKKIGMTQVFRPDGQVVPVTVLKAGPCVVVQRKTPATDGYDAVQLAATLEVRAKIPSLILVSADAALNTAAAAEGLQVEDPNTHP